VHLRYPLRHRERWRSTNLLERSLGEVRRRTKVMGRFPGETSCLSLVWAVLDLFFSHASNGATFTDVDRQHLYRIKYQQADPDTLDEEVTPHRLTPEASNRERIYSGKGRQRPFPGAHPAFVLGLVHGTSLDQPRLRSLGSRLCRRSAAYRGASSRCLSLLMPTAWQGSTVRERYLR
jgi:hypothetical protein